MYYQSVSMATNFHFYLINGGRLNALCDVCILYRQYCFFEVVREKEVVYTLFLIWCNQTTVKLGV